MSKAIIERKNGRKRRKRTIYMPPVLDEKLRVYCAKHDLEVSLAIQQAVSDYLERFNVAEKSEDLNSSSTVCKNIGEATNG